MAFSILWLILIILFVVKETKKQNAGQNKRGTVQKKRAAGTRTFAERAPAVPVPPAPAVFDADPEQGNTPEGSLPYEGEATVSAYDAPETPAYSEAEADPAGCIGGSIGAHEEEGETPEEHAEHMLRLRASELAEAAEREKLEKARQVDLDRLREAVIWSEILDRPVSLRRR